MVTIGREDECFNIDVMPFTKLVWKAESKHMCKLLNTLSYECWLAELITVSEGLRPCATMHITSDGLMRDLALLEELELIFVPIRRCKRVKGFAHKFYEPSPREPYDIYGVVARDWSTARKFKKADMSGDFITVGRLLSYPENCIKFFGEVWSKCYDPIFPAALRTPGVEVRGNEVTIKDYYPEINIILRYFGIRAVPHLVCNFKCKESRDFAEIFLQFISHRKELLEILSANMIWDCYKGMVKIDTPLFIGITNSMPYKQPHNVRLEKD